MDKTPRRFRVNPFRTAVSLRGRSTQISSILSPIREGGPKRAKGRPPFRKVAWPESATLIVPRVTCTELHHSTQRVNFKGVFSAAFMHWVYPGIYPSMASLTTSCVCTRVPQSTYPSETRVFIGTSECYCKFNFFSEPRGREKPFRDC